LLSGLDQCGTTDVPWLSESATEFDVPAGATDNVTVRLNATTDVGITGKTAQLGGAQIQAHGQGHTFSVKTSLDGTYAFWALARANLLTVIAGKDGWIAQTRQVRLRANRTITQNLTLQKI